MGQPSLVRARLSHAEYIGMGGDTQGTETSKYLEEKKTKMILRVAASERGTAQTERIRLFGVVGPQHGTRLSSRTTLESATKEGESPVDER